MAVSALGSRRCGTKAASPGPGLSTQLAETHSQHQLKITPAVYCSLRFLLFNIVRRRDNHLKILFFLWLYKLANLSSMLGRIDKNKWCLSMVVVAQPWHAHFRERRAASGEAARASVRPCARASRRACVRAPTSPTSCFVGRRSRSFAVLLSSFLFHASGYCSPVHD